MFHKQIADFGLLRHASTNDTETQNVKGTATHMAPEAVRGDVGVNVDVYSFGVLVLEVVSGLLSFDRDRESWDIVSEN